MKARAHRSIRLMCSPLAILLLFPLLLLFSGCGGAKFNGSTPSPAPTVSIAASPTSIASGSSSMLSVAATNATSVTVTGSDGSSYSMPGAGGAQKVSPTATTTYTAKASGSGGSVSSVVSITVTAAPPAAAPTVTITANPTSVVEGSSSKLTVVATNATAVTITGSDGSTYTLQSSGGTQAVAPKATTTYAAAATGAGGKASAVATVSVTMATPSSPTVAISANPAAITAGGSSTLTVTAANATAVTVTGSDGSSYDLSATGGMQNVSPAATATYTAKATSAEGNATATAVVTVGKPSAATVTLVANPASMSLGSASTLTAVAANATSVTVTGTDGSSYTLSPAGGTQAVTPAATTTYTATATGTGGNATAVTTVTVVAAPPAAPTVTIMADPASITAGGASTLMVVATNATAVTVTGTDGSTNNLSAIGGTLTVSPAGSTTYTATATGAGGNATATATVTVVAAPPPPAPPTVTLVANPTSVNAGSPSTLTVVATNALTVTVNGSDGSGFNLPATGGTQSVSPTKTTTYTATANGNGGNATAVATVTVLPPPVTATVTISASPATIAPGASSTLTVVATDATAVTVAGSDGSNYTLAATGGTQSVTPSSTTTYTATATGTGGNGTAFTTVTVKAPGSIQSINHVIFMLQENHTFDNYFGMLNNYRSANGYDRGDDGNLYQVDGIDDKLKTSNQNDEGDSFSLFKLRSTCIDDDSSDWLASYGDINRYNFLKSRPIQQNGFVHTAEGFATSCANSGTCNGDFSDLAGKRAMGYYDEDFLNYYYYMASQFAVSDRWFSPLASKSTPNRIATLTGGTTQGLVRDPGAGDDKLGGVVAAPIFQALDKAGVSWRVYYTQTAGACLAGDDCGTSTKAEPATTLGYMYYDDKYLYQNPSKAKCTGTTQPSSVVGDTTNSFCIDPNRIAPLTQYYTDVANGTLASFSYIESGSINDEHPGSGQSVLYGQAKMAQVLNAFMTSASWSDSVFFFSYDEGGGPYDHVPPVPGHSNDFTAKSMLPIPDIESISVNPDNYFPCLPDTGTATQHCDLRLNYPGTHPGDAATVNGFAAQIGFRVPNFVISPFTRRHYVSHIPMDHTAVIKFVENRFIGPSAHMTARDAAQPDLTDFFDFDNVPWATPPTPPNPVTAQSLQYNPCTPKNLGP